MADSCSFCGAVSGACGCSARFTVLDQAQIRETLIASLTDTVDSVRDIYTQLGARPYRVRMVRTRWTGGMRGVGVEEVVCETPILPTPRVSDLANLSQELLPIGMEEVGQVRISEISPRYTEDQLVGRDNDGTPVSSDTEFYYEIEFVRPDSDGVRRRFIPTGVPNYNPTQFQWWIDLRRAHDDRTRAGDPNG
jgi:hypothetical protein